MSLLASNAKSWPPGARTEEIARLTPVWRFGILIAALLHDVGKVLTSFDVELYENSRDERFVLWMPDAGTMQETGRQYYRVLFPERKTAYDVHKTLGWAFFQIIVPSDARRWISDSDPELIRVLRTYLSGAGDDKHPMVSIIRQADMTSTARDLRDGSRQRFATAKRTPLIEIVMETMKEMLHERSAHFSIAITAGGDIFRKSDIVYIMAKNVPDRIREFLHRHYPEFASSFPSDNQRIFDTLLEYGAVLPAPHDESKAIANIAVQFERGDGEIKSHQFTVLQFKLEQLYPEPPYPAEFLGGLDVLHSTIKSTRRAVSSDDAPNPEVSLGDATNSNTELATEAENETPSDIAPEYEVPPPPKARPRPISQPAPASIDEFLDQNNLLDMVSDDDDVGHETITEAAPISSISEKNVGNITNGASLQSESKPAAKSEDPVKKPIAKVVKTSKKSVSLKSLFADTPAPSDTVAGIADAPDGAIPDDETAAAGLKEVQQERDSRPAAVPRPIMVAQQGNPQLAELLDENKPIPKAQKNSALAARKQELQAEGKRFLSWLADGLADGSITVNQNDSMVHFIDRGMILVTPLVFRTYTNGFFDKNNPSCPGLRAQQGFLAVGWHERSANSAIFYTFAEAKFLFTCFLIPEKNVRFIIRPDSRPANNIDLSISDKKFAPSKLKTS